MDMFLHQHHVLLTVITVFVVLLILLCIIDCFMDSSIWSFFALEGLFELLGAFLSFIAEIW